MSMIDTGGKFSEFTPGEQVIWKRHVGEGREPQYVPARVVDTGQLRALVSTLPSGPEGQYGHHYVPYSELLKKPATIERTVSKMSKILTVCDNLTGTDFGDVGGKAWSDTTALAAKWGIMAMYVPDAGTVIAEGAVAFRVGPSGLKVYANRRSLHMAPPAGGSMAFNIKYHASTPLTFSICPAELPTETLWQPFILKQHGEPFSRGLIMAASDFK